MPAVPAADGWAEVADAIGVTANHLVRLHQVHGDAVFVADHRPDDLPPADIVVAEGDNAIAVQAADCVPLLIADARTGVIAAAHAGWRGLAAHVPQAAVAALTREFGSRAADLIAAAGPSIGACCYEVGSEVRAAFIGADGGDEHLRRWFVAEPKRIAGNPSMPGVASPARPGHWFMDTWAIVRAQLEDAGLSPDRIHVAELCTASHAELFCSYRRDGAPAGRLAAVIRRTSAG
jgi:purine-nucleoside/S-methyl-5'-thioadenosine phosphorylase / adenosine deaminase